MKMNSLRNHVDQEHCAKQHTVQHYSGTVLHKAAHCAALFRHSVTYATDSKHSLTENYQSFQLILTQRISPYSLHVTAIVVTSV
jgi:hypothetical protein